MSALKASDQQREVLEKRENHMEQALVEMISSGDKDAHSRMPQELAEVQQQIKAIAPAARPRSS